tara:strand:- start:254 stop:388 length:135 start_codon:yes stop_codon:yes gene_type:complete
LILSRVSETNDGIVLGGTTQNEVMGVAIEQYHALRFAQGRATHD